MVGRVTGERSARQDHDRRQDCPERSQLAASLQAPCKSRSERLSYSAPEDG
jgi:hypothetical protein